MTQSDGITLLSRGLIHDELQRGLLAILPIPVPGMAVSFSVLRLAHRTLSPLGEAFIKAIRQADAASEAQDA